MNKCIIILVVFFLGYWTFSSYQTYLKEKHAPSILGVVPEEYSIFREEDPFIGNRIKQTADVFNIDGQDDEASWQFNLQKAEVALLDIQQKRVGLLAELEVFIEKLRIEERFPLSNAIVTPMDTRSDYGQYQALGDTIIQVHQIEDHLLRQEAFEPIYGNFWRLLVDVVDHPRVDMRRLNVIFENYHELTPGTLKLVMRSCHSIFIMACKQQSETFKEELKRIVIEGVSLPHPQWRYPIWDLIYQEYLLLKARYELAMREGHAQHTLWDLQLSVFRDDLDDIVHKQKDVLVLLGKQEVRKHEGILEQQSLKREMLQEFYDDKSGYSNTKQDRRESKQKMRDQRRKNKENIERMQQRLRDMQSMNQR